MDSNLQAAEAAVAARPNQQRKLRLRRRGRELLTASPFLIPSLLLFGTFFFYPLVKTFYLSFYLTNARGEAKHWVGWSQYSDLFHSSDFLHSLWVTLLYVLLTVIPGLVLSLLLALLVERPVRGITFFRTVIISPITVSVATASTIGLLLFNPSISILNYGLHGLGLKDLAWLTDPFWAMIAVSLVTVWMSLGFHTILLLGGLQNIPTEILESARLDGVGFWSRLRHVILPLISPTLFFVVIVSTISAFQSFGQVNILTQGGPSDATHLIVYSIYRDAFFNFQFGSASAQSIVLFLILLLLTVLQFTVGEKKVHYQ